MQKLAKRVTRALSKLRGRVRLPKPKTFKTEEAANKWAKEQGYTDYKLENLKSTESSTKKIRVIVQV
ncbi:MAG: hypothetical protein PHU51_05480 [Candidatus Nanoarchaeia archaeon]|jgi:hypothetical protein|nr:hypothetical protein [Candidatus Nanoarchaeia archaeon]